MVKINKTYKYIEVIGHYDNKVQCAKMTLLANLYAIEHREGYAKFPVEIEDTLELIDGKLEFLPYGTVIVELNGIQVWSNMNDIPDGPSLTNVTVTVTTDGFTLSSYNDYRYVYSGSKTFAGFENHAIGSSFIVMAGDAIELTVIEEDISKVSCDLTTLPGWSSLSDGNHTITVKAKATGYRDSEASAGVVVNKAPSGFTVSVTFTGDFGAYRIMINGEPFDVSEDGTYTYNVNSGDTVRLSGGQDMITISNSTGDFSNGEWEFNSPTITITQNSSCIAYYW